MYQELETEGESYRITGEHPVWVQGFGWKAAKELEAGDILSTRGGDTQVLGNRAVRAQEAHSVHNLSVERTPSYFVGEQGLWVHNARACGLDGKPINNLSNKNPVNDGKGGAIDVEKIPASHADKVVKGYVGERIVRQNMEQAGYKQVHGVGDDPGAFANYKGQKGIDAIYVDKNGNCVIVEIKTTGAENPRRVNEGCKGQLCNTRDGTQMSEEWINNRLDSVPEPHKSKIIGQMTSKPQNRSSV